jgi:DNA-binding transcriptional ArsR family regulator
MEEGMNVDSRRENAAWEVGTSIALELDEALTAATGQYAIGGLPEEMAGLIRAIPSDWLAEWRQMMGESRGAISLLSTAAGLAGVLREDDYSRMTMAARELTAEAALARAVAGAAVEGVAADRLLPVGECLADVAARWRSALYERLGFAASGRERQEAQVRRDTTLGGRILLGGDLSSRFWHWLDRFYYGMYEPWRTSRGPVMRRLEQRATLALGTSERAGEQPEISWLPAQSPALRYPELRAAVVEGKLDLFFWVEPIGLADAWLLEPPADASARPTLFVSFAEPGELYRNFQAFADDVARRAAALADPTRLILLRLIRHFDMVNTELADYLQLARPTVSVHAKILREAGLIRSSQDGRLVRHEILASEVRRLFSDLEMLLDLPPEDKSGDLAVRS